MNNMLSTIIPKSDQLNADDLIGGRTMTIKVTKVSLAMNEQPVAINYEGDNGKPFKPGKSMRRVLVNCWGSDANLYVGRSMKLYCDPNVMFAGQKVGGIRISHLSDIKEPVTMALTTTKAQRRPFTVNPLMGASGLAGSGDAEAPTPEDLKAWLEDIAKAADTAHLKLKFDAALKVFKDDGVRRQIIDAKEARKKQLTTAGADDVSLP